MRSIFRRAVPFVAVAATVFAGLAVAEPAPPPAETPEDVLLLRQMQLLIRLTYLCYGLLHLHQILFSVNWLPEVNAISICFII